jgi:hypothetical protein
LLSPFYNCSNYDITKIFIDNPKIILNKEDEKLALNLLIKRGLYREDNSEREKIFNLTQQLLKPIYTFEAFRMIHDDPTNYCKLLPKDLIHLLLTYLFTHSLSKETITESLKFIDQNIKYSKTQDEKAENFKILLGEALKNRASAKQHQAPEQDKKSTEKAKIVFYGKVAIAVPANESKEENKENNQSNCIIS